MANLNNFNEQIDRFLNKEMSDEEMQLFIKEVNQNPALKKMVEDRKLEKEALELLLERRYRAKMDQWSKEEELKSVDPQKLINRSEDKSNKRIFQRLALVAVVLILMGGATYFWISSNYSDAAILANHFYSPNKDIERIRLRGGNTMPNDSTSETTIEEFEMAKKELSEKQYKKAIERLTALSSTSPKIQYLLAHAYLGEKNYSKAIPLFKKLADRGVYQYQAKLYLMYAYLGSQQTEEVHFRALLKQIMNDADYPRVARDKAAAIDADLSGMGRKIFEYGRRGK